MKTLLCILLTASLLAASCKKSKPGKVLTELEKLPPITQTGVNTFGCLVDGIAWLPNGSKPQTGGPNIQVYVDPTFQGGAFYITGNKYQGPYQTVAFGSSKCVNGGSFTSDSMFNSFDYKKTINGGTSIEFRTPENGVYRKGFFNISRYDLISGVFSGTFEVKLYKMDGSFGDTLRITNGRFDVKL
jgi:hypothetical protein